MSLVKHDAAQALASSPYHMSAKICKPQVTLDPAPEHMYDVPTNAISRMCMSTPVVLGDMQVSTATVKCILVVSFSATCNKGGVLCMGWVSKRITQVTAVGICTDHFLQSTSTKIMTNALPRTCQLDSPLYLSLRSLSLSTTTY